MLGNRRRLIVLIATGVLCFVVIALLIGISRTQQEKPKEAVTYNDPYSGETLVEATTVPESDGADPNTPIFMGMSKLLDYGITFDQLNLLRSHFEAYNTTRTNKFKEISVVVSSITQQSHGREDPDPIDTLSFDVVLNRSEKLHAKALYAINAAVELIIYDTQGKEVFNTTAADLEHEFDY